MRSFQSSQEVHGLYIETFISIDNLTFSSTRSNSKRVRAAAECAAQEKVGIVTLGGFTSVLLEGDTSFMSGDSEVAFTTGNTLTAAYI
jgi:fatty aldehyde-generating acyl-ACP reductase